MKYIVTDDCIGCGLCVSTCPEVFSMTDASVAAAIKTEVPDAAAATAEEAMDGCPVQAIKQD